MLNRMLPWVVLFVPLFLAACGQSKGPRYPATDAVSLRTKAMHYEQQLTKHITPEGLLQYVSACDITAETIRYRDLADGSMWAGALLAAETFRYCIDMDPDALEKIKRLLAGLEFAHDITGTRGLFCRCVVPDTKEYDLTNAGGKWFKGKDAFAGYRWRGDLSKSNLIGIVFGLSTLCNLSSHFKNEGAELHSRARKLLESIAFHLMVHDMQLEDPDGEKTRHGDLRARTGFHALLLLAIFKAAAVASGNAKYADEYRQFIDRGYDEMIRVAKFEFGRWTNHSDSNALFLAYYTLLPLEKNHAIVKNCLFSLDNTFDKVRHHENSFFDFVYLAVYPAPKGAERIKSQAQHTLASFPDNQRCLSGYSEREENQIVPVHERPKDSFIWKENPYLRCIGGQPNGLQYAGVDYLLAYWLGRYHGLMGE